MTRKSDDVRRDAPCVRGTARSERASEKHVKWSFARGTKYSTRSGPSSARLRRASAGGHNSCAGTHVEEARIRRRFHRVDDGCNAASAVTCRADTFATNRAMASPAASGESSGRKQITGTDVPDGHLTAVAGMHVHAQEAVDDDGQFLSAGFRVDRMSRRKLGEPSAGDERLHRGDR